MGSANHMQELRKKEKGTIPVLNIGFTATKARGVNSKCNSLETSSFCSPYQLCHYVPVLVHLCRFLYTIYTLCLLPIDAISNETKLNINKGTKELKSAYIKLEEPNSRSSWGDLFHTWCGPRWQCLWNKQAFKFI